MISPRIYTEAELHLMPFCFGSRRSVTYTEAEVQRWLHLRAIEWSAWPLFFSQVIVPILLFRFPVLPLLLFLALIDLLWRFISTSWISMALARAGPIITLLMWPSAIVCACLLAFSHRYGVAVLALVWPLVGGFVSVFGIALCDRLGVGTIGAVERALAARIGYPDYLAASQDSRPLGDSIRPPSQRPLRIVALDDEAFMGEMLKMMFQFYFPDSVVVTYTDAELALQELEREDPDLFITDWNHPGRLHGGGLLQVLADMQVTYPIFVITASGMVREEIDQFINQGLNVALLSKPITLDDLRRHLSLYLDVDYQGQEKSPSASAVSEA